MIIVRLQRGKKNELFQTGDHVVCDSGILRLSDNALKEVRQMKVEAQLFLIAVALCIANFLQSRDLVKMANEIVKLRITVKGMAMKLKELEEKEE